jgi:F-type H+-transporting ATPase subunit gamma
MALSLRLFPTALQMAMRPYPMASYDFNQQRNMATLKEVKARIRSIKSIQKITKSMKLVATTRLKKAELAFEKNKPSLLRLDEFLMEMKSDAVVTEQEQPGKRHLIVCMTTERGLCGSVNR